MRKIVVADSTSISQFMLARIFVEQDIEIIYVRYPRDLIAQVKYIMPDIVFLEAEISGGKGRRIVEYLQRKPETRHIPIVLITRIPGANPYGMRDWPGVCGLIRKPINSKKVLETVSKIFESTDTPERKTEAS